MKWIKLLPHDESMVIDAMQRCLDDGVEVRYENIERRFRGKPRSDISKPKLIRAVMMNIRCTEQAIVDKQEQAIKW
jgi:hypothetical protein